MLVEDNEKREVRVKFITDVKDIVAPQMISILNDDVTKNQLLNIFKKLTKYKQNKDLDVFIKNILFIDEELKLKQFLANENIERDENILEILISQKREKPKLNDVKKQDEWIKQIKFHPNLNFLTVGMFDSEVCFYEEMEKNFTLKTPISINDDNVDYLFLNNIDFVNSGSKQFIVYNIRDLELIFKEIKEEELEKRKNSKIHSYSLINSSFSTDANKFYTILKVNPFKSSEFLVSDKDGLLSLYNLDNLNFEKNNGKKYKQTIEPLHEIKISTQELKSIHFPSKEQILMSDLSHIHIVNPQTLSVSNRIQTNNHLTTSIDNLNSLITTSHDNGSIKLWDTLQKNPLVLSSNKAHKGYISKIMCFDKTIISGGQDGCVKFWDIRNLKQSVEILEIDDNPKIFDFALMKKKLVVGGSDSKLTFFDYDN